MSYEKLTIVGNLGKDLELHHTSDGTPVTTLSVAVNKKRKEGSKVTTWYEVSVFGKSAENAVEYLKKGSKVLAECSNLRVNPYLHKDGKPDAGLEAYGDRIVYLDGAEDDTSNTDLDEQPEAVDAADIPL
jgi:single-strand DNA-binding protein